MNLSAGRKKQGLRPQSRSALSKFVKYMTFYNLRLAVESTKMWIVSSIHAYLVVFTVSLSLCNLDIFGSIAATSKFSSVFP